MQQVLIAAASYQHETRLTNKDAKLQQKNKKIVATRFLATGVSKGFFIKTNKQILQIKDMEPGYFREFVELFIVPDARLHVHVSSYMGVRRISIVVVHFVVVTTKQKYISPPFNF